MSVQLPTKTVPRLRLLIAVVTFNSERDIEACIRSISRHVPDLGTPNGVEVCVVDNASIDHTGAILNRLALEYPWLHLRLLSTNIGFGCGNNIAMQEFDADAYFLLNADAYLLSDSLTPALSRMAKVPRLGVIGLPLVYPDGRPQTYSYAFSTWHRWALFMLGTRSLALRLLTLPVFGALLRALPYGQNFARTHSTPPLVLDNKEALERAVTLLHAPADWVSGAAMLLSRDFVRTSGGFDSKIFLYGEDEDICIDAHRRGFGVETLATVPIVHVLGWGKQNFRPKIARMKYDSLRYFINKNIRRKLDRVMMRVLLPFYVYGWRAFRYLPSRDLDE